MSTNEQSDTKGPRFPFEPELYPKAGGRPQCSNKQEGQGTQHVCPARGTSLHADSRRVVATPFPSFPSFFTQQEDRAGRLCLDQGLGTENQCVCVSCQVPISGAPPAKLC